jgi:hypothetical protein
VVVPPPPTLFSFCSSVVVLSAARSQALVPESSFAHIKPEENHDGHTIIMMMIRQLLMIVHSQQDCVALALSNQLCQYLHIEVRILQIEKTLPVQIMSE